MKRKRIVSILAVLSVGFALSLPTSASSQGVYDAATQMNFATEFMNLYDDDQYGGMYYDSNGVLVINMMENEPEQESMLATIEESMPVVSHYQRTRFRSTDNRRSVRLENAVYSLQYLKDAMDILNDNMLSLNIRSIALSEKENKLVVGANELTQEFIASVTALVDENILRFEQTDPRSVTAATADVTIYCGSQASVSNANFSIGYPAIKAGIVHGFRFTIKEPAAKR
ncbi:MAG: hypothetical protein HFJ80_00135 [Clostridiales bacterium]|nr:hypothetical protein [Clostridiales bacterium]